MINFSIFVFMIYAVWDSARQILFGTRQKHARQRRRAPVKRMQPQRVSVKATARQHKTATSPTYFYTKAARRASPSALLLAA